MVLEVEGKKERGEKGLRDGVSLQIKSNLFYLYLFEQDLLGKGQCGGRGGMGLSLYT